MNAAATIGIVVAVIVLLAAVVLVTAARRSDVRGAGASDKPLDRAAPHGSPAMLPNRDTASFTVRISPDGPQAMGLSLLDASRIARQVP